MTIGHYLGPLIDVGSALTAKILKSSGLFVCCSTFCRLNDEELTCPIHTTLHKDFDDSIKHELGPAAQPSDFPAEDLTPDPMHYDETNDHDPDHGDLEVTPEEGDFYVNAEVMLPKGGTMSKGCVRMHKHDSNGNVTGHANDNLILDTRSYVVDFGNGDTTELTANRIAESMYAQCDPNSNQYVLLDDLTTDAT